MTIKILPDKNQHFNTYLLYLCHNYRTSKRHTIVITYYPILFEKLIR